MPTFAVRRRHVALLVALLLLTACLTSCGSADTSGSAGNARILRISSIPDQDPDKLGARDGAMATYLAKALHVKVEAVPVTDYAGSVSLFHAGDLDLVFYGASGLSVV